MTKIALLGIGLLLTVTLSIATKPIATHLSGTDLARLQSVFREGLTSNDIQSLYYASINVNDITANERKAACSTLSQLHSQSTLNEIEKNFYIIAISKKFSCTEKIDDKIVASIKASLTTNFSSSQEAFYGYFAAKALGLIDENVKSKLASNIQALLKKDDSLTSLGHGFYVASELGTHGQLMFEWIESAFAQADEVDGKMLQFEGGLSITGLVFNGGLKLVSALNKPIPLNEEQIMKFVTYFLSRRSVQIPKGASILLETLQTITELKSSPICIQILGTNNILSESPVLNVKIVDVLGKPVKQTFASITANIIAKPGNVVILSKAALQPKSSDKTVYSLDLSVAKPARGQYNLEILADNLKQVLNFKVLGKVQVQSFEIGVGESDSTSSVKKINLAFANKLDEVLHADFQQKLVFRALLVDQSTTQPLTVHQAFVRLENQNSKEEIIFVAEQDSSKAYKFDMDVGTRGGEFGFKSGLYSLEFFVGDASLSNSFKWYIGDVQLKFSGEPKVSSTKKIMSKLPEIHHQFRQPEKRPALVVSTLFTALCAVPLLVLFILWIKLGVNVSNLPFNLYSFGFHLGFGVILSLFGLFFMQLNMFETIRYLIPVALLTFFCGNRLLRSIAANKTPENK